jgi:hypothetical protein
MYLQKSSIGGFSSGNYWSSSDTDVNNAWKELFSTGTQTIDLKTVSSSVRCVRQFYQ